MSPKPPPPRREIGTTVIGSTGNPFCIINLLCPWCDVVTQIQRAGGPVDLQYVYLLATCQQTQTCGRTCMVVVKHGQIMHGKQGTWPLVGTSYPAVTYPSRQRTYAEEGVDADVAADFTEALRCRENGFLYASALVARRVLQMTARSIVGKKANLKEEIDALPADRISPALKEAAHEVRYLGNEAAHAGGIDEGEVDQLLGFTELYLEHLFVLPARTAKIKAGRSAPTTSGTP